MKPFSQQHVLLLLSSGELVLCWAESYVFELAILKPSNARRAYVTLGPEAERGHQLHLPNPHGVENWRT